MGIDTSALFGSENMSRFEPVYGVTGTGALQPQKNGCEGQSEPHNGIVEADVPTRLQREADKKRTVERQHLEGLQAYQENIRRAGSLRTEILKATAAGTDTTTLFLKAAECISLMTGDTVFYSTIRDNVRTIHGGAYLDPVPLQQQYDAAADRLQKLRAAVVRSQTDTDRQRLQHAIQEHEKQLQDLDALRG